MKITLEEVAGIGNLELLSKHAVEGFITGLHHSPYHGFSVEFAEHRLYNTGESTRHIDWKVYAKTGKLFTKRYEEETNLRCYILIDISSSMFYPIENKGKLVFSLFAAASLANLLHRQRDAVGISLFDDKVQFQSVVKTTSSHLHTLYSEMDKYLHASYEVMNHKTEIANSLNEIAQHIHKRSLVIIFSDMLDNQASLDTVFAGLQHIKHQKSEIILFHVKDKSTEQDFNFDDRVHEFIDMESGAKVKLNPGQLRESYVSQAKEYYKELKIRCEQNKISFIEADINEGVDPVLTSYLIKRTKMS